MGKPVQRVSHHRFVRLIVALGVTSLGIVTTATTLLASQMLVRDAQQRAFLQIDANIRVARRLLHERGADITLRNGQLYVGDTKLDGHDALADEIARITGGDFAVLRTEPSAKGGVALADTSHTNALWQPDQWALTYSRNPYHTLIGPQKANQQSAGYFVGYDPLLDVQGNSVGALVVGLHAEHFLGRIEQARVIIFTTSIAALLAVSIIFGLVTRSLLRALQRRQLSLEDTHQRLDLALDNMSQGLIFFDKAGRMVVANDRYFEIYRLPPGAITAGMSARDIMEIRRGYGTHPSMDLDTYIPWFQVKTDESADAEIVVELADGRMIAIHRKMIADGGSVSTHEDITERHQNQERLAYMAGHDSLTGLPNRLMLQENIDEALKRTESDELFAVLYLDLDQFKGVNDTLGHAVGDRLLQSVAERLRVYMRAGDMVARLGGDEFAILLRGLRRAEEAKILARQIIASAAASYDLGDHQVQTRFSIGITFSPTDGKDRDSLLTQAEMALYRAKSDGRGTFRCFEPAMDEHMRLRRAIELDLRQAIEKEQFILFYQPMIDIWNGHIIGFEALLRWQHPERGMISPAEFIPILEETGLIVPVGAWAIRQACEEAMRWPDSFYVAVNVSPLQFKGTGLVVHVREALHLSGLAPHRLELEITESLLLQNSAANLAVLHELRGLGTTISMDDFGTGFSSLSYLRSFPFDKIKIDQSFVRDLTETADSQAIIEAVIELGRSLGMRVLAEGVETEMQLESLRKTGCENVQGYYFSRPKPAAEIPALIAKMGYELQKQPAIAK
jgi:diguanylate cyclase (GGDEF)-like protein